MAANPDDLDHQVLGALDQAFPKSNGPDPILSALDAAFPRPEPTFTQRLGNTASAIGGATLEGLGPTQMLGHLARTLESGKPSESVNFLDTWRENADRQVQNYPNAPDANEPTLFGVNKGQLRQEIAPNVAQAIPMGVAMLGSGPVGWGAGALGLAGMYHESQTQAAAAKAAADEARLGRPLTLGEKQAMESQLEPDFQKMGAAELIPEIGGTLVDIAAAKGLGPFRGLVKPLASGLGREALTEGLKRAGIAGATTALSEVPEEIATGMMQQPIESRLGMTPEAPRDFTNPADWMKTAEEVTGPTLRGMLPFALLGGGAGGYNAIQQGRQAYQRNLDTAVNPQRPEGYQPPLGTTAEPQQPMGLGSQWETPAFTNYPRQPDVPPTSPVGMTPEEAATVQNPLTVEPQSPPVPPSSPQIDTAEPQGLGSRWQTPAFTLNPNQPVLGDVLAGAPNESTQAPVAPGTDRVGSPGPEAAAVDPATAGGPNAGNEPRDGLLSSTRQFNTAPGLATDPAPAAPASGNVAGSPGDAAGQPNRDVLDAGQGAVDEAQNTGLVDQAKVEERKPWRDFLAQEQDPAMQGSILRTVVKRTQDPQDLADVLDSINPQTMADSGNVAYDVLQSPYATDETKTKAQAMVDAIPALKELDEPAEAKSADDWLNIHQNTRTVYDAEGIPHRVAAEQPPARGREEVTGTTSGLTFRDEVRGAQDGQIDSTLYAMKDGKPIGRIDYSIYNGKPAVQMIEVDEDQRRKGYGTELLLELQRQFPDTEIDMGEATPEGAKLIESLPKTQTESEYAAKFDELQQAKAQRDNILQTKQGVEQLNDLHDRIYDLEQELFDKSPTKTLLGASAQEPTDAAPTPRDLGSDATGLSGGSGQTRAGELGVAGGIEQPGRESAQDGAGGFDDGTGGTGVQPPAAAGDNRGDSVNRPALAPQFTETDKDNRFKLTNVTDLGGTEAVRARLKEAGVKVPGNALDDNTLQFHSSQRDKIFNALEPTNDEQNQLSRQPEQPAGQEEGTQAQAETQGQVGADTGAFDSAAWNKKRDDRIKASREAGNQHLDQLPAYVETMRGKRVHSVHDPKVTGTIRTVDNSRNVYVDWDEGYSAEKEMAKPSKEGAKTVYRTSLGPTDLKDYVVGEPAQPEQPARQEEGTQAQEEVANDIQSLPTFTVATNEFGPAKSSQEAIETGKAGKAGDIAIEKSGRPNQAPFHTAYVSDGRGNVDQVPIGTDISGWTQDRIRQEADAARAKRMGLEDRGQQIKAQQAEKGRQLGIQVGAEWAKPSAYVAGKTKPVTFDRARVTAYDPETGQVTVETRRRGRVETITTDVNSRLFDNYPKPNAPNQPAPFAPQATQPDNQGTGDALLATQAEASQAPGTAQGEQPDTQGADTVPQPDTPDENALTSTGLLRQWGDRWQYKSGGSWKYANSREGAVESATEAWAKTPPEQRLTREQRDTQANDALYADMDARYGQKTVPELEAEMGRMDAQIAGLQRTDEFTGQGTRRTGAAVSNEGARQIGEDKLKLGAYLDMRRKREGNVTGNVSSTLAPTAEPNAATSPVTGEAPTLNVAQRGQFNGANSVRKALGKPALTEAEWLAEQQGAPAEAGQTATTPEQAIRDAADKVQDRTIGSWYPITVSHSDRTQQFMSNIKRVRSDGKTKPTISLAQVKPGRLIAGEPIKPLFYSYKLTKDNKLVEEGVPRYASEAEIKRWEKSFGKVGEPTQPTEQPPQNLGQKLKANAAKAAPTVYDDPRMKRPVYRDKLNSFRGELTPGGDIQYIRDENDRIVGRTASINPQWFQNLPDDTKLSVEKAQKAIDKADAGKKLGIREQRLIRALLDEIQGERTAQKELDHARNKLEAQRQRQRQEREAAKAVRETLGLDADEHVNLGYEHVEDDYDADADHDARIIADLAEQYRNTPDADENWLDALLEKDAPDAEIARQLQEKINGRSQQEGAGDDTQVAGETADQAGSELFGGLTAAEKPTAERLALEERQKELARQRDASQAPRGGGLFDIDNRQDDIFSEPTETLPAAEPTEPKPKKRKVSQKARAEQEQTATEPNTHIQAVVDVGRANPFTPVTDLVQEARSKVQEATGKSWDEHGETGNVLRNPLTEALHEGQYQGQMDYAKTLPVTLPEISLDHAIHAYGGTSHSPEQRGKTIQQEHAKALVQLWRGIEADYQAATPERQAAILETFNEIAKGYTDRINGWLSSRSRVMSAMIAGGARFPTESNNKRDAVASKKAAEAEEYYSNAKQRLKKAISGPKDNSTASILEDLKNRLDARERQQERMKQTNAALRRGDDAALRDMGHSDAAISRLKLPDFAGRTGYASFELTNNNAEIRRLKGRIAEMEAKASAASAGEAVSQAFNGGTVERNNELNRLQIFFDSKPDAARRELLKANGFKWAPSQGAWQRQLTANAEAALTKALDGLMGETDQGVAMFSREARFSFAGQQAATADTMALSTAQQRLDAGENAETVRQETGWFKGKDGKWRFEINDADAKLKNPSPDNKTFGAIYDAIEHQKVEAKTFFVNLGDVLDHPALFAAYPRLSTLEVDIQDKDGASYRAANDYNPASIAIGRNTTPDRALSYLLHEIQHGIQRIEGFATGGSPLTVDDQQVRNQLDLTKQFELTPIQNQRQKLFETYGKDVFKWPAVAKEKAKALKAKEDAINQRYADIDPAVETYRRLAGEVEARNVQTRQTATDAERRALSPQSTQDVADYDVIVTFNGKVMENAPMPRNLSATGRPVQQKVSAVLSRDAVQARIDAIRPKLRISPNVTIKAVDSEAELPADIQAQARKEGAVGQVIAVHQGNSIYLVAGKHDSAAKVEESILHESNHYGANVLFGRAKHAIYNRLFNQLGGEKGIREYANRLGLKMEPYFVTARESRGNLSDMRVNSYLVDEFLANAQGTKAYATLPQKIKTAIQEFYGAIRNWLRQQGFAELAKFTDADLAYLLRSIHQAAQGEVASGRGKPMFMRTFTESEPQTSRSPTIDVDGVQRPTTNSEGRPIHPTEEGIRNFWRWFSDSRVVDEQGRPLVVYHGTDQDFSVFQSMANSTVHYADDVEVNRADSWDMGDDRQGAPDAYHYMALSHAEMLGAERAMKEESESAQRLGYENSPDHQRYMRDLSRLLGKKVSTKIEKRPSGDGFYFTADKAYSFISKIGNMDGGNVMSVYLSIKNPVWLNASQIEGAGASFNMEKYEAQGHDGAMFADYPDDLTRRGWNGSSQIVAFSPTQIKSATGNRGTFDGTNPDIRFSRQYTPEQQGGWNTPVESKMDDLIRTLQNKHIDTKRVVEAIKEARGAIDDRFDPELKIDLYDGRVANRLNELLLNEVEPFYKALGKSGVSVGELEKYLHARHAEERNEQMAKVNKAFPDGGSGMTNQEAWDYLASVPNRAALDKLAEQVDAINRGTKRLLVDEGLETQATIDAWDGAYQHYVPLFREEAEGEQRFGNGTGPGFSVRGPASKRAMGSSRNVVDILANSVMARERALTRAEKNRVSTALFGAAAQNPADDFWRAVDPDKSAKEDMQDWLSEQGLDDVEIEDLWREPRKRVLDKRTGQVAYRLSIPDRYKDNVVSLRIDGRDKFIFFNQNNPRALEMARALKNLDTHDLGTILTGMRYVTRWVSSVNTQFNPIFGITNIIRDTGAGLLNLESTDLKGQQLAVLREVPNALAGIYRDVRADRKGQPRSTSAYSKLFEEYEAAGGETGYRDMFRTSQDRADALQKIIDPSAWADSKWGKLFTVNGKLKAPYEMVRRAAKPLFDWLSDYNRTLENGVRLAAYKVAKDNGMSVERAAQLAKNLTVNFNKKGQIAQQAGAMYAFFNASMQGSARIAETLLDKRGNLSESGKMIVKGGMLLGVAQALMLAGYDDDEPPEFVREKNFVIPLPDGKYASFPYPLGFHILPNTGRVLTDILLRGKPGDRVASLLGSFIDAFNPIGSAGLSLQTITPTAIDPLAALAENKDWTGKPIAKENFSSLSPTPGFTRAKDTASWFGKAIAEMANTLSGGTDYVPGAFSPTPDQIDYLIGQATGGVGRELMKAQQLGTSLVTGEEIPPYKVPGLGRFFGSVNSQAAESSRFYDNLTHLNMVENTIRGLRKDGKNVSEYLRETPEARLVKLSNTIETDIRELRARKRALIEKDAPKMQVQFIENAITSKMKRLNEAVSRLEK